VSSLLRPALEPTELGDLSYYFVLDDEDRVVHVGPRRNRTVNAVLGQLLWAGLPEAQPLLGPRFAEARSTGEPIEFTVFYDGGTTRFRAIPAADGLAVHAERLTELDVRTLAGLAESLGKIEAELTARAPEPPGRPAAASLRAPLAARRAPPLAR
jgi:hypothetical protein